MSLAILKGTGEGSKDWGKGPVLRGKWPSLEGLHQDWAKEAARALPVKTGEVPKEDWARFQ